MKVKVVTVGPLAAPDADGIAASQTPTSAVTINGALASGGVATMDTPRRVIVTTGGSEAGKTMTIVGTTYGNSPVTDVLSLPSSATSVASVIDFATVTSATISSAAGAALTIGTNGTAGSPWVGFDSYAGANVSIQCSVSGTVNYTVQQTLDDPDNVNNSVTPYQMVWVDSSDTAVVSATASKQSNYLFIPRYARVFLNSQTNPGYVRATFIQVG